MVEVLRTDPATDFIADNALRRANVDEAIRTSVTDAEKQQKVRDVLDNVADAEEHYNVAESSAITPRGAAAADVAHSKDSAKEVRRAIMQLLQMVVKDAAGDVDIGAAAANAIPDRSKQLLQKLNTKIGNNLSESGAVFLYPLVKAAVSGEIPVDQLQRTFNGMKGKVHQSLLKKVRDAIVEQHADYGQTEAEFEALFDHETMTGSTIREVDRDPRGRRGPEMSPLSANEQTQAQELWDEINEYPPAAITDSAIRTQLRNELLQDIARKDVDGIAAKLNWSRDKAQSLLAIEQRIIGPNDERLRDYSITAEDLQAFNPAYVLSRFDYFFKEKDGKLQANDTFKGELVRGVYQSTNKLLQRVSANPDAEWRDNFSDLREGAIVSEIRNRLFSILDSPGLMARIGGRDAQMAFRDVIFNTVSEIDYEISAREALHTVRKAILGNQADAGKIAEFLKRFPSSRFSLIMRGFDGDLIEMAREEIVRDVSQTLRTKSNIIPADFFASYYTDQFRYSSEDQRRIKDNFIARLKLMGSDTSLDPKLKSQIDGEPWQIERALALGSALSLVADMRIIEELATADVNADFKGGVLSMLGAWGHLSRIMRAQQLFETQGVLYESIPMTEEQRKATRGRSRNPLNRHRYFHKSEDLALDRLLDDAIKMTTTDAEAKYGIPLIRLIREYFTFSFLSKGSWRLDTISAWYKSKYPKALGGDPENWRETYKNLQKDVGVGIRWFFDERRASSEAKDYVLRSVYGVDYEKKYTTEEIDSLFKKNIKPKSGFKFNPYGELIPTHTMEYDEFVLEKTRCYRGMNFLALIDRSPYDFMLNMSTLEGEIMAVKTDGNGKKISAHDFYFSDGISLNKAQQKERKLFRKRLERKWGEENVDHVARIMEYWDRAATFYLPVAIKTFKEKFRKDNNGQNPTDDQIKGVDLEVAMKLAQQRTYLIMGTAAGSVKMKNKSEMTDVDVVSNNPDGLDEQAFMRAQFLRGDVGLQHYFYDPKRKEHFGDKDGEEGRLGSKGFFYTLATRWFELEQRKLIPSTSETRLEPILSKIASVGDDVIARAWEDIPGYGEVGQAFVTFDQMLRSESRGDPKAMDEFMQNITKLASKEGNEGMFMRQYIVGYARQLFFKKFGHETIDPLYNPRTSSDSRTHFGPHAKQKSTEETRLELHEWYKRGWLPLESLPDTPEDKDFSVHSLMKALSVDTKTYAMNEYLPKTMSLLLLMYILAQLKQAYDEEFEQKKAA